MRENTKPGSTEPNRSHSSYPPGHPLHTFRQENEAITRTIAELRAITASISVDTADPELEASWEPWLHSLNRLREIERHYQRKESLLFAYLDKYGISEPARDMWNLDNQIRRRLKELCRNLENAAQESERMRRLARQDTNLLCDLVESMILAEEKGLLPHCESRFTAADWGEIHSESSRFGYCLVEPGAEYAPPPPSLQHPTLEWDGSNPRDPLIRFATGALTASQLATLFRTLPCDVTLVDAADRIVFYSDPPQRHFSRTPALVGRPLSRCHPPASEAVLEQLLADFHTGQADASDAVVQRGDRFFSIRYLAVRDEAGRYQGCLEMALDITEWLNMDPTGPFPAYDRPAHPNERDGKGNTKS
jgi:DUF438 domain-containing protein